MIKEWTRLGLGIWVALSPWILGVSDDVFVLWSNLGIGLALVILSLWTIFGRDDITEAVLSKPAEGKAKPNGKVSENVKIKDQNVK